MYKEVYGACVHHDHDGDCELNVCEANGCFNEWIQESCHSHQCGEECKAEEKLWEL